MHHPPLDVVYEPEFLTSHESLFAELRQGVTWDARMFARKTASFGEPYNYSQMKYEPAPMPPRLGAVIERLEARLGFHYDNCLVNLYETGEQTMGFHVDAMDGLVVSAGVAIVSLGAERTLVFRRIDDKSATASFLLAPGSLLWMSAGVQDEWKHGVLREPGAGARISLTFRAVRSPPQTRANEEG